MVEGEHQPKLHVIPVDLSLARWKVKVRVMFPSMNERMFGENI